MTLRSAVKARRSRCRSISWYLELLGLIYRYGEGRLRDIGDHKNSDHATILVVEVLVGKLNSHDEVNRARGDLEHVQNDRNDVQTAITLRVFEVQREAC
jgi:hypothetical protein